MLTLKKLVLPALIAGSFISASAPVAALNAGDWLVRGRLISIMPNDDSSDVTSNGTRVPNTTVSVDNGFSLDIDFTYMFTKNIGAELLLDLSSKHDVTSEGATLKTLAPGEIISANVLPPSLLLQYHFLPDSNIRPYVGAGFNFTYFFNEKSSDSLNKGLNGVSELELDSSFGWAAQVGLDYDINKDLFLNVDVKYLDINTTASFKSGALGNVEVDVDVNPWVFGIGVGSRF